MFWSVIVFSSALVSLFKKVELGHTAQKIKISTKDFFNKCNQICRKLRIWSQLLKKSLMKNVISCAVTGLISSNLHCLNRNRFTIYRAKCLDIVPKNVSPTNNKMDYVSLWEVARLKITSSESWFIRVLKAWYCLELTYFSPVSHVYVPPEHVRKPLVFWRFQGV